MSEYPDFESFSDEELERHNQELQRQRTAIGEEQDALVAVRDRRFAEAQAEKTLEGLSPGELDVLIEAAVARASAAAPPPGDEEDGS